MLFIETDDNEDNEDNEDNTPPRREIRKGPRISPPRERRAEQQQ